MTIKRVVPRDEAHRDVESAIDHYAHEAGPDVALGFVTSPKQSTERSRSNRASALRATRTN
jgi:toxin ParE1/3/4